MALLTARELLVARSSEHAEQLRRYPGIDDRALSAATLAALREALGARAGWALGTITELDELWRAELALDESQREQAMRVRWLAGRSSGA